ncbi:hypothetical protein [Tychonema sp. LEGE 06208]|uniref:hypothetical protein n=1 Tax=Tychonema sp. LEGE 06208 TaxID=1828663 RepID=UPI00187E34FA|nr:hypothetical protein [Tychonema sp. LEGE 06208]MBE9163834.1 hypothetical protein [Tychonema sp. LEGE 06208]
MVWMVFWAIALFVVNEYLNRRCTRMHADKRGMFWAIAKILLVKIGNPIDNMEFQRG